MCLMLYFYSMICGNLISRVYGLLKLNSFLFQDSI